MYTQHTHTYILTSTQVCPYNQNTSTCDCTTSFTSTTLNVPTPPRDISFPNPIGGLEAFTLYCMQTITTYMVVPGFSDNPERLTGNSGMQRTGGWLCLFGWTHMATAYTARLAGLAQWFSKLIVHVQWYVCTLPHSLGVLNQEPDWIHLHVHEPTTHTCNWGQVTFIVDEMHACRQPELKVTCRYQSISAQSREMVSQVNKCADILTRNCYYLATWVLCLTNFQGLYRRKLWMQFEPANSFSSPFPFSLVCD